MSDIDKIKWFLSELANADGEDIESNELEIYGEDARGVEGSFTEQITNIAAMALSTIEQQKDTIDALNKVVEAADAYINTDWTGYEHSVEPAFSDFNKALAELQDNE